MAEGPNEQSNPKKLNLPSLHHRVEDQVSSFIKRGLSLANEIEAKLEQSAPHPDGEPPQPQPPSLTTDQPVLSGTDRSVVTQLQVQRPQPAWSNTEETDENSWAIVWLRRGVCKYQQADYSGAKDNFQQALKKQPTLAAAYNGLGSVLYQNKDFVEAVVAYHQGLDYAAQSPELYCNLGSTLFQIKNFDEAALAYQKAIYFNPRLQVAYYGLGLAQHQIGFLEEAATAFEQATQLNGQHAHSFVGLAATLYDLEEYQDANQALRMAMKLDPAFIELYLKFQNILIP
ncbi:tetratricopeptide repeat protein [Acaryochloris sp. IP29b_bin.137]|uniref:tetratricopeptide repeat protein n=1 Tax=Acaryochloris sp. IP29b_bin.137 TaxID=2969217 RepID=UPI0026058424|nr:tetratricopeptide repeat protein [Acaryochloris sp. IP29b_bin.137]